MITVFYDGKCGLCSKEISFYKGITKEGVFDWQDITQSKEELTKAGICFSQALMELHVRDYDGKIYFGVDAFLVIWRNLGWTLLTSIVALPGILHVTRYVYGKFARWRFKRLKHCQLVQ